MFKQNSKLVFIQNCQTKVYGGVSASLRYIERKSAIEGTTKQRGGYRYLPFTVTVYLLLVEDEIGPADPVDAFKNGGQVGGIIVPTGEGFLAVELLGKVDDVANLVDPPLTGKRVWRTPLLRGNAESSCNRDFGVSVSASPQTDRHLMAGRGRGKTPSLKGATCRRSRFTTARRVAGGEVICARSPVPKLRAAPEAQALVA